MLNNNQHRKKGSQYELIAKQYLIDNGLKPVDENFSSRFGEIDLIMLDANTLVFIEVKFRKNESFAPILETITAKKQQKIQLTAQSFLSKHSTFKNSICRFDVIAITQYNDNIQWIKNAFQG